MNAPMDSPRNDLSLLEMLRFLGRHIVLLAVCIAVFMIAAGVMAFTMRPMYRSEVVVSPANTSGGGLGEFGSQIGGLASLAGINIGSGGKKSDKASNVPIARLHGRVHTASCTHAGAIRKQMGCGP